MVEETDMKLHRLLFLALAILMSTVAVSAQGEGDRSGRGQDEDRYARGRDSDLLRLAAQLTRQTDDLQRRTYADYGTRTRNSREDTQSMLAAAQLNASATLFRTMINDRRRRSEMREVASLMNDLASSGNGYSSRYGWNAVQQTLNDIQSELTRGGGGGFPGGGFPGPGGGSQHGTARWSGTADDEVQLKINGRTIETLAISGSPYNDSNFAFTEVFPNREVNVSVRKLRGRGEVRVLQQPSRSNGWTAIVQIRDTSRGSDQYELEITW
jgi:hypothetical protein